jgi:hypothetical protein
MAISLKTAGTWAEYTTDLQTVTIPGSPAAGDRMFLFVAWKDFAITLAQPSGWSTIVNSYADGTSGTGNGTGSMSQAIFYRDWQSGDTAPQLDFSTTTGLLAEAVVMLWQKGAGDLWDTPKYVTSAHSFSTSSVYENADQTVNISSGAVVMCQVATRDDSATFTRTTTSIADSGGLITWNGNYVESPATHYSTTTGNDHSGDLGHRLVTTGANAVTLQAEAVQSAADSGSLVWVVQELGVNPSGTSAVSLPATTVAATGAETFTATSAVSLPAVTVSATGDHSTVTNATGTSAVSLPSTTVSASGVQTFTATAAAQLAAVTVSATGVLTISGTSAVSLPAVTVSASGTGGADDPVISFTTGRHREPAPIPVLISGAASVFLPAARVAGKGAVNDDELALTALLS